MIKKLLKNFIKQIRKDFQTAISFKAKDMFFLSWPFLIAYYSLIGLLTGFNSEIVVLFIFMLFLTRVSLIGISMAFFISAIVIYLFGARVDANHQMSFMFVFLFLSIFTQLFKLLFDKDKDSKKTD